MTFFKFIFFLKNGPPEAVKYIFFIKFLFWPFISLKIEKCSESIGTKVQLNFISSLLINFHPQIILSLFAIKIFFENLIILIVGIKPAIPEIADTVISNFIFFNELISSMIKIFFFLQKFFILFIKIRLFV